MSLGSITRRPAALLALGLCFVGVAVSVLGRLATGPAKESKRTEFTNEPGAHAYPAFSPDGKQVAFSAHGISQDDAYHVYIRPTGGGASRQVTSGEASDIAPVWSPDGATLAFARIDEDSVQIMTVPAAGGDPRKVAEFAAPANAETQPDPSAAWMRDGKSLVVAGARENEPSAISLVNLATGAIRRITNPAKGTAGDVDPAVAPDGNSIAFVRISKGEDESRSQGDIYICDLSGNGLHPVTWDNESIRGIAWTPDGRELLYGADRMDGWRLWRVPAYGGTPRDMQIAGQQAQYPALSRDGQLAFTERANSSEIWRAELNGPGVVVKELREKPIIRSQSREVEPVVSPDGKSIANISDQTFEQQIWIGDVSGITPRYQLTQIPSLRLEHIRWSPDSKQLLYQARSQRGQEVYKIEVKPGAKAVRILQQGDGEASWSHDGKSIYYTARNQVWKANADGSNARLLTPERRGGASDPEESVDGKLVFFRRFRTIWQVGAEGGTPEEAIRPEHNMLWASVWPVSEGVYYMEWTQRDRGYLLSFFDFRTKNSIGILTLKNVDQWDDDVFSLSPDQRHVLYAKTDRRETNLVMVENFR